MKNAKLIADTFNEISAQLGSNFRLIICEKSYHLILRDCRHETYLGIARRVSSVDKPLGEWHFYPITESCWSILEEFRIPPLLKEAGVEKLFNVIEKQDIKASNHLSLAGSRM